MLTLVSSAGLSELQTRKVVREEFASLVVEPDSKRSRTGWREFSTLQTQDCAEVKLWNAEVLNRNVSDPICCIFSSNA